VPTTKALKGSSDQIDVEIGARIRTIRRRLGLSQTELGQALGVTFQQVQKYERGANRVAGSTLVRLCRKLNVAPADVLPVNPAEGEPVDWSALQARGAGELLQAFQAIESRSVRAALLQLARDLASPDDHAQVGEQPRRRA
jgi:transcriptional regulator with XRE-family HTH domain